ncbi:MAG: hypothetical protein DWQ05_11585 [Calditrichaeota bacterium]|nr:MAG: hypothetical protein DWQ05_11585 [Calditrichota bacterium]
MIKILFIFLILFSDTVAGENKPTTLVFPTRLHIPIRKATKFHLFLYAQNRVKVNNPQGIAVTRLHSWEDSTTSSDDDEITIYGVNSGQGVVIYNASMYSLGFYGLREKGKERLKTPHGITAAPWGDVYVADTGNDRVVHLFNPKKKLSFVRAIGTDDLKAPRDVELTSDSTLFVSDTGNNRILRYKNDKLENVIITAGKDSGFVWQPTGLAAISKAERWSFWDEEFLIVIDLHGQRLQKFTFDGELKASVVLSDLGFKKTNLQYAEIDYFGQVWVTDKNNHCVYKFDRNLRFLDKFGKKGNGDFEFMQPRGISFHRQLGQILIAEKEAAQYYWIGTDVQHPSAQINDAGFLELRFFLTEPSYAGLEIEDRKSNAVWQPLKKKRLQTGENVLFFDSEGRYIPTRLIDGKRHYFREAPPFDSKPDLDILLTLSATYSSYKYFEKIVELKVK